MEDQFIFICTNIGNEKLLKEEVLNFYPELKFGYSRKGFITFKNTGIHYTEKTISQLVLAFSTRAGICIGKARPEEIYSVIEEGLKTYNLDMSATHFHNFSIGTDYELDCPELDGQKINKVTPVGSTVIDLITLSEKEVWVGLHSVAQKTTKFPNSVTNIELPENSPSRNYLKIAQALRLFEIKISKDDKWIDFGSAPGGTSHYLLERGCRVWGVDPAKVSNSIDGHRNYKHISKSVQDLSQEKLPDIPITWVNVDLNLNPKQAIKEVLRLIKKYNFTLKGVIFSIQMIKMDHVKNIENFEEHFYDWGFTTVISRQLPSHKSEYTVIALKDRNL